MARRDRTTAEVREAFSEQVTLLVTSCNAFDSGLPVVGKQLATLLRTLLYAPTQKRNHRTIPLVQQMHLVGQRFVDSSYSIDPKQLSIIRGQNPNGADDKVPACGLVGVRTGGGHPAYYAPLDQHLADQKLLPYAAWWTMDVMRDKKGKTASRFSLVAHVADTDGGSHVDAALDSDYFSWKQGISLGWVVEREGSVTPLRDIELHCMRQIAHEVLRTLQQLTPWAFIRGYPFPAPSQPGGRISNGVVLTQGAGFELPDGTVLRGT